MADRMTFTLVGRDHLSRAFRQAGLNAGRLKKDLIGLGAAAALPATAAGAAGALALAGAVASAGTAVLAFGLAVGPQAVAMGKASEAQKKYREAVEESGRTSQDAAKAQLAYARAAAKLPPATREAAAGLSALKDAYKEWSDGLAGDTMPVLTKSFSVFSALLPKLSPLVRGASSELDRLMTIVAGGVASKGFDRLIDKFSVFATRSLRGAVDGVVHLSRTLEGFDPNGGAVGRFLDYARENGPLAAQTLKSIGQAAANLLEAGGAVGVAMLTVANALARVVNAVPAGALSALLQLYAAFRLLSLAAAGVAALRVVVAGLGVQLVAMRAAATGAVGGLATLRAAWLAMSATARATVVVAAVAALVVVLVKLSNIGRSAPPDVDRLTTSLGNLGRTGRVAGEAAKAFGTDLGGLADSLRVIARPDLNQGLKKTVGNFIGFDAPEIGEAKKDIDALDKALASLVKSGNPELAAKAFQAAAKAARAEGLSTKELRDQLDHYKSALADAKFEQELAAESMGLFGSQAQATGQKLAGQKASADGLRQAIQALNDVQRAGLGGMIAFEASIDAAAKAAKKNADSLRMVNGHLDVNSPKAQAAASALQDLASKTDEAAASAREADGDWTRSFEIAERGKKKFIELAMQMGLTSDEATALAAKMLDIPDKEVQFEGNLEDLEAKVAKARKDIKSVPPSKLSAMLGKVKDLEDKVAAAKRGLKSVPASKRSELKARIDQLQAQVRAAKEAIASVKSRTVTITANYIVTGSGEARRRDKLRAGSYARGGLVGFPGGGLLSGPGTDTSDSLLIRASRNEFVTRAAAVRKYGTRLFEDLNAMRVPTAKRARRMPAMAGGASTPQGGAAGVAVGGTVDKRTYTTNNTYNVTTREASLSQLQAMQRTVETRNRLRRPR